MGEHAAVYHRPALVAAVDLRLRVRLALLDHHRVEIDLPQIGYRGETSWAAIREYAKATGEAWRRYAHHPTAQAFTEVQGEDPAHLVKIALAEAASHLGESGGPPLHLRIDSDLPIGAGFGSSAAIAVGVVAAYLSLQGCTPGADQLYRLSLEVERRQHGMPSGIDNATVLHGGILWARNTESGGLELEQVSGHSPVLSKLRIFHSGTPEESTGAVVAAVRERMEREPGRGAAILNRLAELTTDLRELIGRSHESAGDTLAVIRECEAYLDELGVVPAATRHTVRQIEERGGAAKISGAGSLTGPGAGTLIVYHPDPETIDSWEFLRKLPQHRVRLGVEGVRQEAEA
jgi:mevalonate kinase